MEGNAHICIDGYTDKKTRMDNESLPNIFSFKLRSFLNSIDMTEHMTERYPLASKKDVMRTNYDIRFL